MPHRFSVTTPTGEMPFEIGPETSLLFVGANGGGKSRLAIQIELALGAKAHRISAHRILSLNTGVSKLSERQALAGLRTGTLSDEIAIGNRIHARWGGEPAIRVLNDYDFLIQALFAEQTNTSYRSHQNSRAGNGIAAQATKLEKLIEIWARILPHRTLHLSGDDIKISVTGSTEYYPAAQMSDGERAIFYLIGQTLMAVEGGVVIFDEPELHIHRSIMSRLWDELEAARPDCSMIFISHDLEFVASRSGKKYVLKDYTPNSGWIIEEVPEDTGFSEELVTLILGSRKPILFVEGQGESLDKAVFRACYPEWTVVPRGSCEEVIRAVVTMRANANLTRIKCSGIVDADDYSDAEKNYLKERGIEILPVSEIENIFLLPKVAAAIARVEGFDENSINEKLALLYQELLKQAVEPRNLDAVVARYCHRRIDRALKRIDLSAAKSAEAIATAYADKTAALDIGAIAKLVRDSITTAAAKGDIAELLKWYDNKGGNMAVASKIKGTTVSVFEQWVVRALRNNSAPAVSTAIKEVLPEVKTD